MLSKNRFKYLKQLHQRKFRDRENIFIVEGKKMAMDVLRAGLTPLSIVATEEFFKQSTSMFTAYSGLTEVVNRSELEAISLLSEPNDCILICEKIFSQPNFDQVQHSFSLFLDGVRDPGNLGTIIRLCDWFGIQHLFCSPDTVDVFNPKVIQSSMGSFIRVMPVYIELNELLEKCDLNGSKFSVFGTFMEGKNVFEINKFSPGILIIGNEANGIRTTIHSYISEKVTIPRYGAVGAESLNAAMATAVILGQYRRVCSEH